MFESNLYQIPNWKKIFSFTIFLIISSGTIGQDEPPIDIDAIRRVPDDAPAPISAPQGEYGVVLEEAASLPGFTIYAPQLSANTTIRLPVVAWGNGGCANDNRGVRQFLTTIASHGYLVIAPGVINPPENAGSTNSRVQIQAMDWADAENNRSGSQWQNHIDANNYAVMGWSCGGLQSIENSNDPRVASVALFNSGVFPSSGEDVSWMDAMTMARKSDLAELHTPIAYIAGGPVDIAYPQAVGDFEDINHVPVFFGNIQTGHMGTFAHPGGGWEAVVASQWLDWTLKGDEASGENFLGVDCSLCTHPDWVVQQKNL